MRLHAESLSWESVGGAGQTAAESNGRAATPRYELKYLVPDDCCAALAGDLRQFLVHDPHATAAGGHHYVVRSLYFDTPGLRSYYDKLEGANCRAKVRIRRYETPRTEPSDWFLEIKSKYHNAGIKPRRVAFGDALLRAHLCSQGALHLNTLIDALGAAEPLSHQSALWAVPLEAKVLILYDREPLLDPRRGGLRVTLDANIRARFTTNPHEPLGPSDQLPLPVILEVKFAREMPFWLEALIRKYRLRLEATSKYAHGVESAFPLVGRPRARAFSEEGISPSALGYLKQLLRCWNTGGDQP